MFEPATFSLRFRLSSTRIRCIRASGVRIRSPERKFFNIRYESGIVWTLNPNIAFFFFHPVTSQDRAHHECSRRCRAQCYRFFTFYTSVSSLITCVQLNLAMITVHFNYAKQRLDILKLLSMSDWRIGCRKQVKRGKQCLVGQFCQWNSYWRSLVITFGNEPKIVLQISWHPDTCGRVKFDSNTDSKYVWTWKFWIRKEKFADSKLSIYVQTGKGPSHRDTNFFRPEQHQQQCLLFSALGTNALCTIKRQIP